MLKQPNTSKQIRGKKLLICLGIFFYCLYPSITYAAHISGGELYYRYIGPGTSTGTSRYEISLRLFRDCNPLGAGGFQTADLPTLVVLGIFSNANNAPILDSVPVQLTGFSQISLQNPGTCIQNAPPVCYQIGTYSIILDLQVNDEGYKVVYQSCCRANGLSNISETNAGATYLANIPGTFTVGNLPNSSPVFSIRDTVLVCRNRKFSLPFSAIDPDGDSLSYRFCEAYNSLGITDANIKKPFPPPYTEMNYRNNFSGISPLGNGVNIQPQTGLIEGIAPEGIINPIGLSYFVVTVCVTEWRNGLPISEHRKDFIIRISPCEIAQASLQIDERNCDTYAKSFINLGSSSQIQNWFWDFGVPNRTDDTSTLPDPNYVFPDTGTYRVKLVVNKETLCADSTFSTYYIYPGFFPKIKFNESCKKVAMQFEDATSLNFGSTNYWFWDFGVGNTFADTSVLKNPQYTYTSTGTYTVELIVGSSKGCLDTTSITINVPDKPNISITNDTTICVNDPLQLKGTGTGTWQWLPNKNINTNNIANPVASPDTSTTYYATLTTTPGCFNTDSVKVTVKKFVLLLPLNDTTICLGDTIQVNPISDGLKFNWQPSNNILNPNNKNTGIIPSSGKNKFKLTASIGSCTNIAEFTTKAVPYPVVNAGKDSSICFKDPATLKGSGTANIWEWSPAITITKPNEPLSLAFPSGTQQYILKGTSNNGCPKPVFDTMLIKVIPPVIANAGSDTSVVVGQPLQLNASGATKYQWTPNIFLSNQNIPNPVAIFNDPEEIFTYILTASTPEGCVGKDTLQIKIFKTTPGFFVPTAFTPDNNGLNDIFKPIPAGIAKFDFFKIYNRWGNEIFSTNISGKGWDGTYKGQLQEGGIYVWIVQGIDFTGRKHFQKGTVTLIK